MEAGADKISINSSAVKKSSTSFGFSKTIGSQCVVVAIDTKFVNGDDWEFCVKGGREITTLKTFRLGKRSRKTGSGRNTFNVNGW